MQRLSKIAPLLAAAAFAFVAGASVARAEAISSPAPARTAAHERHSVAGASATATHPARARHRGRSTRGRRSARAPQLTSRRSGRAAGGPPPQPARHIPTQHHHAALNPSPHYARHHTRGKAGGHGSVAEIPAGVAMLTAMSRAESQPNEFAIAQDDPVKSGRGPPRAGPHSSFNLSAPPSGILRLHFASQLFFTRPTRPTRSDRSNRSIRLSRDRLLGRPHACRQEGTAACLSSPSQGDLS